MKVERDLIVAVAPLQRRVIGRQARQRGPFAPLALVAVALRLEVLLQIKRAAGQLKVKAKAQIVGFFVVVELVRLQRGALLLDEVAHIRTEQLFRLCSCRIAVH